MEASKRKRHPPTTNSPNSSQTGTPQTWPCATPPATQCTTSNGASGGTVTAPPVHSGPGLWTTKSVCPARPPTCTRSQRLIWCYAGLSLNALTLLTLTHLLYPRARPHTRPFFTLAYHHPDSNTYHQGPEDFFYVITWIVLFTGLRAAVMTYVLLPCAELAGLRKVKTKVRFAEQAWLLLYYSVFWSLGMVCCSSSLHRQFP